MSNANSEKLCVPGFELDDEFWDKLRTLGHCAKTANQRTWTNPDVKFVVKNVDYDKLWDPLYIEEADPRFVLKMVKLISSLKEELTYLAKKEADDDTLNLFNERVARLMERTKPDPVNPTHYSRWPIEPIEFITANNLDFLRGNVIKYIMRYDAKGGVEDLRKARFYLDKLIEQQGVEKNGN